MIFGLALFAFLAALCLFVLVALGLGVEVVHLQAASFTPTEDLVIDKIAYYLPPSSPTPTEIVATQAPTAAPSPASTATGTRTRAPSPTRPPSATLTITPSRTTPLRVALQVITRTTTPPASPTGTPLPPVSLNETYGTLPVLSRPDDRAVDKHADLNLNMRGYAATNSPRVLIDYDGDTDAGAPQLAGLFGDNRTPAFATTFRVFDWDWSCNCRGPLLDDPEVTLVSIQTSPGEVIRVPSSGAQIGNGYSVLVLYADSDQITLKYTRSDGAVDGYTLHIQGISADSSLLALYAQANSAGRAALPALRAGQSFGKAKGSDIRIAIRDAGTFMDPRSRKDWWKGR